MGWADFVSQLSAGMSTAAIYFLIAAGLSLVFGVLHILNFAHGSFFLLGAYMSYGVVQQLGGSDISFFLAVVLGPVGAALFAGVFEIFLLRRVYRAHILFQFILMFGLIYVLSDLMKLVWGVDIYTLKQPDVLSGSVSAGKVIFPSYFLFTLAAAFLAGLVLWFIIYKSRFGKLVQAVYQDTEMAGALGINVPRIRTAVFVIGSYLAGFGGAVAGGSSAFYPGIEAEIAVVAFALIVIGGPGGLAGPLVSSLLIGIVEAFGIRAVPQLSTAFMYILLIVVLRVRPWGLVGKPPIH